MKRIRHRLGRWLLRDAPRPEIRLLVSDPGGTEAIHKMLLKLKRERGGGSLGLS
jgi:hypothetical protein